MASAHHNGTRRKKNSDERKIAAQIRKLTPPDNHDRTDTPVFNAPPFKVRGDQNDLYHEITGVLGSFEEKKAHFRGNEYENNRNQPFLGVHRLDSVDGLSKAALGSGGSRKSRPPPVPAAVPPSTVSPISVASSRPSTSSRPPPTERAPPPVSSLECAHSSKTLSEVLRQMKAPDLKPLSPMRESAHATHEPPHDPNSSPFPHHHHSHHHQPTPKPPSNNPSKSSKTKIPVQQYPMKIQSTTPPEKMSPDSTTTEQLWVKVNYSRLSSLKLAQPVPDSIKRKIDQTESGRDKKRLKTEKRRKPEKPRLTKKTSREHRGSSKEQKIRESPTNQLPDPISKPDKRAPEVIKVEAAISAAADSSAVTTYNTPLKPYTNYIEEGKRLKVRAEEYAVSVQPIPGHILYMESIYHYIMAAHQLECDFIRARQSKNEDGIYSNRIIQLINDTLELCYRIRQFGNSMNSLDSRDKKRMNILIVLCFKCEAHLNLLFYKCDNAKRDMLKEANKITEITKLRDKGDDYCRGTPTSPIMSEEKPTVGSIRLEHDEWSLMKQYLRTATYLVKAHNKWKKAEQIERETNSSNFFTTLQRISEMRELSLMSSLKDLSTYQKAVVDQLREEIFQQGETVA